MKSIEQELWPVHNAKMSAKPKTPVQGKARRAWRKDGRERAKFEQFAPPCASVLGFPSGDDEMACLPGLQMRVDTGEGKDPTPAPASRTHRHFVITHLMFVV